MRLLTLAIYGIKRIFRNRPLLVTLYAIPLLAALLRIIFVQSQAILVCAWACLFVCIAITGGVVYFQHSFDKASGLHAGMSSSPVAETELIYAKVLTGLIIFGIQAATFLIILSIRFH